MVSVVLPIAVVVVLRERRLQAALLRLESPQYEERLVAARALAGLPDPRGEAALLRHATSEQESMGVVDECLVALIRIGSRDAAIVLRASSMPFPGRSEALEAAALIQSRLERGSWEDW